ncbi:hypothetical protein L207DRAFT_636105 [Hyaloscypha variabilis F]|uniref:Uncharacterized protein n=1 Tax=Hyaloscypha variabilis (strain UAMH 11265 / GT02V1 / F) TaxID=1149755 RepID=A0A2J6RFX4_HYAVF|nr:hypothetical protein L207DRAFT_636105 [Hyaloscypha variabilis F]
MAGLKLTLSSELFLELQSLQDCALHTSCLGKGAQQCSTFSWCWASVPERKLGEANRAINSSSMQMKDFLLGEEKVMRDLDKS